VMGLEIGFVGLSADVLTCACLAFANAFSRSTSLSFLASSRSAMTSCKLVSLFISGLSSSRNLSGSTISFLSWCG
jgi:hypothetical protein